ncbi:MAG: APH(3') family aminoglycoside O-phosphotransferase [Chloroflexota bacterium]
MMLERTEQEIWLATITAKDGTAVRVRLVGPDDVENLITIFDHMGPESRYQRFHRNLEHPPQAQVIIEAERIAQAEPEQQEGLIGFADLPGEPGAPVGAARYVVLEPGVAEVAMSVRDDCQGLGIGTRLLQMIAERAREAGIRRLTGEILNENEAVWVVLKRLPYRVSRRPQGLFSSVEIDLTKPERFEAVGYGVVVNTAVPAEVALLEAMPPVLGDLIQKRRLQQVRLGQSGNLVYRLSREDVPDLYLKVSSAQSVYQLQAEARRLEWLHGRLPVPELCYYGEADGVEYLLMKAVVGRTAIDPHHKSNLKQLVDLLAEGLHQIHAIPVEECPFDQRLLVQMEIARLRLIHGQVDEADFEPEWQGKSAVLLFEELLDSQPDYENLHVTHGDYCLPNVLIEDGQISGFIDWGLAGVADRYRDLALAARSLRHHWGEEWVGRFFDVYGIKRLNKEKLAFYTLLDEFF